MRIIILTACVLMAAQCLAKPEDKATKEPDALEKIIERKETRKVEKRIEKSTLRDGMVTLTYSDGSVVSEPVKRVVQSGRVTGAVNVALSLKKLEKAAYAAAKLKADATSEEKIAVLDTLAAECGKTKLGNTLAAAAAAALAGLLAGRQTKKEQA